MENSERKQMIQTAFDTVADGYDHPSLAFSRTPRSVY